MVSSSRQPKAQAVQKAATNAARSSKRRAADVAYDQIEAMISRLEIEPDSVIVESELAETMGLGRTPVREALLRMISIGLVVQLPQRGLRVSNIDVVGHLDVIQTRRALEQLLAKCAARRASPTQRKNMIDSAENMVRAAETGGFAEYMQADQDFDHVVHDASRNQSAVNAVLPLVVQCRRFWFAYQHEGDIVQAAQAHLALAQAIVEGEEANAVLAANQLMDYLEQLTRRVIDG